MLLDPIPSFSYNNLETLWSHLLSRDPTLVQAAYESLSTEEKKAILAHLQRMASENDWHPEQRLSAQAAIQILLP